MKEALIFTPGPVPIPPSSRRVLSQYIPHHRSDEFSHKFLSTQKKLSTVFQTREHCFTLNCSGTGAMEASITNLLKPKEQGLFINAGKFGNRWAKIAQTNGVDAIEFNIDWGKNICLESLEKLIQKNSDLKALFIQASETSTGALFPIEKISILCQKYNLFLVVDGITAVGSFNIPMDAWNIDILIGSSQKGFQSPTGLSFLAFSKSAWKKKNSFKSANYYFDLKNEYVANLKGQTQFSSAAHLIFALDESLNFLLKDGLSNQFSKTLTRASAFRESLNNMGLSIFAETPSPSLSVIMFPEGINANDIKEELLKTHDIMVAGGQDQLKGKVIRVGHMGFQSKQNYIDLITAINSCLKKYNQTSLDIKKILEPFTFIKEQDVC